MPHTLPRKLTILHLDDCPYCHQAKRALDELRAAEPAYRAVEVEWIEESKEPGRAEAFDYYYVPTIYAGGEKLYEANPGDSCEKIRCSVKKALDAVV